MLKSPLCFSLQKKKINKAFIKSHVQEQCNKLATLTKQVILTRNRQRDYNNYYTTIIKQLSISVCLFSVKF